MFPRFSWHGCLRCSWLPAGSTVHDTVPPHTSTRTGIATAGRRPMARSANRQRSSAACDRTQCTNCALEGSGLRVPSTQPVGCARRSIQN
eukprot:scaffold75988_cov41-Prasinocladus_malaysianus.AAC.1